MDKCVSCGKDLNYQFEKDDGVCEDCTLKHTHEQEKEKREKKDSHNGPSSEPIWTEE